VGPSGPDVEHETDIDPRPLAVVGDHDAGLARGLANDGAAVVELPSVLIVETLDTTSHSETRPTSDRS
jgi:hypothetical protein